MTMLFINLQREDQDKVKDVSGLSNGLSLSNNLSLWNVLSLLGKCVSIDDAVAAHITPSVPVSSWPRVASSRTREASSTRHRADRGRGFERTAGLASSGPRTVSRVRSADPARAASSGPRADHVRCIIWTPCDV